MQDFMLLLSIGVKLLVRSILVNLYTMNKTIHHYSCKFIILVFSIIFSNAAPL